MHRTHVWKHRAYGSLSDPIHKSHMSHWVGMYACARQFAYARNDPDAHERSAGLRASLGTAGHEILAAILEGKWPWAINATVMREALTRAVPEADADDLADTAAMIVGVVAEFPKWILSVVAVEPGFIGRFGEYWIAGHIDLIYEPVSNPGTIAICDWKFGSQKPHPLELQHGYEAGLYSAALRYAYFELSDGTARHEHDWQLIERAADAEARGARLRPTYDSMPSQIHQVHLADYVPYKRSGAKDMHRAEDLDFFGYTEPTRHKYQAGDRRGGAWMPVALEGSDLARFYERLRAIVGTARMGRFIDAPGEKCTRCHYRLECLNSGYAATESTEEAEQLQRLLDAERDYEKAKAGSG